MPPKYTFLKSHYNKLSFVFCLSLLVSPVTLAAASFEGLYAQLSTGYENNLIQKPSLDANYIVSGTPVNGHSDSLGDQHAEGMPIVGEIGYTFALGNNYTLGTGLDYTFTQQHTNNADPTWIASTAGSETTTNYTEISYKVSNQINAFLTPGYLITPTSLLYGKIGYSIEKIAYTWNASTTTNTSLSSFNTSKYISGYVLGAGYKQIFSNNWYIVGEFDYSKYGKHTLFGNSQLTSSALTSPVNVTTSSSQATSMIDVLIGIGYKF